jgi:ABC-type transport system involved in multi-copper enzyme maturation permease subunit
MSTATRALNAVYALALNTLRETVRDKILYSFVLFAFLISCMSMLLGSLSVGQDARILQDVGLAAISFVGGIIALFAGTNLVYKELDKRTIYIIFTKPLRGWHFILGKFLGLSACIWIIVSAMGLFLSFLVLANNPDHSIAALNGALLSVMPPVMLVFLELLFVIAIATFFSTFASPLMSVLFTLALWLIGHFGESLRQLGQMSQNPAFAKFSNVVYFVLPDLAGLTRVRSSLMYNRNGSLEVIAYITCYVFAYVLILLVLASMVTDRREFQ